MGWFRRNEHDEEQLSAYLDGELDARHAENVERHLATCDACAMLLEELRSTRALLSALPAQTPRRSFVLGAEYARAPVREVAPPRRFGLALAPAVALSVFVALIFVDLADFSSTASDESTDTFTAASQRQAADDDASAAGSGGPPLAPSAAESASSQADGTDSLSTKAAEDAAQPTVAAAAGAPDGGSGGAVASPEGPPAALSAEAGPTPAPDATAGGEVAIAAAEDSAEAPAPEPVTIEAPEADGDGGISTLRILQVGAAGAFLASGFYVFLWPRLSRGGSNS